MNDTERFKLLHGPYAPPRCRIGRWLVCCIRGDVVVHTMSSGLIPWPQTRATAGRFAFIVCGDLERAIRSESATAVCHWWGVNATTVSAWRKALGVGQHTEGTLQLHSRWTPEVLPPEVRAVAIKNANTPEANAKKSAACKQRGAIQLAALARGREEAARDRKESGDLTVGGLPWTADEDALLGTMSDSDVARQTDRTELAARCRRQLLGIPARRASHQWMPWEEAMLGKSPDAEVERRTGRTLNAIRKRRETLGVAISPQAPEGPVERQRGPIVAGEAIRATNEPIALLHGPYHAPALRKGDWATCLFRGCAVVISSWTDALIPWPRCTAIGSRGGSGLLVDDELARAVQNESAAAVMHWWGVGEKAIWHWRKALGVTRINNPATHRLIVQASRDAVEVLKLDGLPDDVCDRWSEDARRRNQARHFQAAPPRPLWTAEEVALLGTDTDEVIAAWIGRTPGAVRSMRGKLGIATAQDRRRRPPIAPEANPGPACTSPPAEVRCTICLPPFNAP